METRVFIFEKWVSVLAMSVPQATPESTPSNGRLIARMFGLAWRYRARCCQVLGLQLVLLTLGLSGLSLTGVGIDYVRHVLSERGEGVEPVPFPEAKFGVELPREWAPMEVIVLIAGCILALAGTRAVLNYLLAMAVNKLVQQEIVVHLRSEIYEKLQRLSFRFFDANSTGSIITRVTGDVQAVRMFVDQVLIQSVIMVVSLTVYVIYMASLHAGLALTCLATTPVLWIVSVMFSRRVQPAMMRNQELKDKMIQNFTESVQGIQVTKGFGREREDREKFERSNRAVMEQQTSIFWSISLFGPSVGFLTRVNMMVLLGYGGWLVINGQLALGAGLVVFWGVLEQFSGQVNQVATIVNSVQQALIGARRVFEIMDTEVEVKNQPNPRRYPRLQGEVRFEKASFSYRGVESVVREVDLVVKPGQCVAILGATGAGKSALMSLIPRFFDVRSGRVLVDGVDVRELHLDDLRRNIGLVFQESFLFSNTVAANIAFGHPDATREQIEKAARIAAAHDFILALPQGYDTVLGESGSGLSGGQRQRLAIARAVLLEPAILLLDDPTAAIDAQTEHEIFEALDNAIAGRTTFIVAHRLSTLRRADFIIVMEAGRIVQRGTHEELMCVPGPYMRVADLQLVDRGELQQIANAPDGKAAT